MFERANSIETLFDDILMITNWKQATFDSRETLKCSPGLNSMFTHVLKVGCSGTKGRMFRY